METNTIEQSATALAAADEQMFSTSSGKTLVFVDGQCVFCQNAVAFIVPRNADGSIVFASLQSDIAQQVLPAFGVDPTKMDTMIAWTGSDRAHGKPATNGSARGSILIKSDAALWIAGHLKAPWRWATVFRILPTGLRNFCYDLVARNRYRIFGKTETCMLPTGPMRARFVSSSIPPTFPARTSSISSARLIRFDDIAAN